MSISEIKSRARAQLGNSIFASNWLLLLVVCLIVSAILGIANVISLVLIGPLYFGMAIITLGLARGKKEVKLEDTFKGFTDNISRNIVAGLLYSIFIFLWSLLFVIPGIVAMYSYSMTFYIAKDHPEYDAQTCLKESKKLMQGHKGELFLLDLSFIGWIIVGLLCCGVGILWVMPYMQSAHANFYESIRGPINSENADGSYTSSEDNGDGTISL